MKRSILIAFTALIFSAGAARAQWVVSDPANLAQSIVNSSNEMVNTSSTAQTMIKSFQETRRIYEQGKQYYDRLRAVSDLVRSARKVQQCILIVGDITQEYVDSYQRMLADTSFSDRELAAIASGYTSLLQQSADALKDLQGIVNPSDLSMTDKDRLDVVDKTHAELTRLKGLTRYFTRKNIGVSQVRSRKKQDMERFLSLYGTQQQRYW